MIAHVLIFVDFSSLTAFKHFFSMATVSAVFQPCRTCHMLFALLARCVVCVFGI